ASGAGPPRPPRNIQASSPVTKAIAKPATTQASADWPRPASGGASKPSPAATGAAAEKLPGDPWVWDAPSRSASAFFRASRMYDIAGPSACSPFGLQSGFVHTGGAVQLHEGDRSGHTVRLQPSCALE